jgi:hypothetical protein
MCARQRYRVAYEKQEHLQLLCKSSIVMTAISAKALAQSQEHAFRAMIDSECRFDDQNVR